jgi:methyl-accepting chemotaxis protein
MPPLKRARSAITERLYGCCQECERELAERTVSSVDEIGKVIDGTKAEIDGAVASSQVQKRSVGRVSTQAGEALVAIDGIVNNVEKLQRIWSTG